MVSGNDKGKNVADDPRLVEAQLLKLMAETEKLQAERLVALHDAELRKAEARERDAKAAEAQALARAAQIRVEALVRQEEIALAQDLYHHEYDLGEISEASVRECLANLALWHRIHPECPMTLVMDSPGGAVIDGLHLFDQLVEYSLRGGGTHHVTIKARGMAASMGAILLQAADVRVIGRESWLMIHEVSSWHGGSFGELKDKMEWLQKLTDRVAAIFVERSNGRTSAEEFARLWTRKEKYLDSEEALERGFVDLVL